MFAVAPVVAAGIVVSAGFLLIALAAMALARPALARGFLLRFAKTAKAHYTEMAARIVVCVALVLASPRMLMSQLFFWFGAALLVSSILLLCLPWKWHRSMGACTAAARQPSGPRRCGLASTRRSACCSHNRRLRLTSRCSGTDMDKVLTYRPHRSPAELGR
jgi:hypothetical protein